MKKLIGIVLLFAPVSFGAWTHTNGQSAKCTGAPVTCAATAFSSALTNPSIITAWVFTSNSSPANTFSVADTAGNTYVDCGDGIITSDTGPNYLQCFYAVNTHTTASNIVTMTQAQNASVLIIVADEYTGGATVSVSDGHHATSNGSSTTSPDNITCGAIVTTVDGDLIYSAALASNGALTAGTGFTRSTINGTASQSETQTQSTHGSITPTHSDTNSSDPYACAAIAFKPAGAGTVNRHRAQVIHR